MTSIHTWVARWQYELFALGGAVVVLWQMLLPGYVLTLDLIFGPHLGPLLPEGFFNGLPITVGEHVLAGVMPVWMVEKVLLMALVFALFYVPLRFFPFEIEPRIARYAGAVFFAVNPFVYERFLAGHWLVLAGYAALVPCMYSLVRFLREPSRREAITLGIALAVVGVFSLHYFTMAVLVSAAAMSIRALMYIRQREWQRGIAWAQMGGFVAATMIIATSYWTVPILFGGSHSPVGSFGPAHWHAFMTDTDPFVGTLGNVAMLYGFWAERYYHLEQFVTPAHYPLLSLIGLVGLGVLIVTGAVLMLRTTAYRAYALWGTVLAIGALVFSAGIADSPVQSLNMWLFDHVGFWSGFRDTQKWSAFLIIVYALFSVIGVASVLRRLHGRMQRVVLIVMLLVPIAYTPTMMFGLMGQLRPVWYPHTWYEAHAALADAQRECKAVFLPWHQYYTLSFNNDLLTAHLASRFFDCEIVTPQNTELGDISSRGVFGPTYDAVELAIEENDPARSNATIEVLKAAGIEFIIVTDDIKDEDPFKYPFLTNSQLTNVYEGEDSTGRITVFQLETPRQYAVKD